MLIHNEPLWATLHFVLLFPRKVVFLLSDAWSSPVTWWLREPNLEQTSNLTLLCNIPEMTTSKETNMPRAIIWERKNLQSAPSLSCLHIHFQGAEVCLVPMSAQTIVKVVVTGEWWSCYNMTSYTYEHNHSISELKGTVENICVTWSKS